MAGDLMRHLDGTRVQAYLEECIELLSLPGLALGISDGDGFYRGFETLPFGPGTLHKAGSLSKLVTGLAVFALQEEGRIELSDPVDRHLPWFDSRRVWGDGDKVTIRDLLLHTGGLPRGDLTTEDPSTESLRQALSQLDSPGAAAGSREVKYSNLGYALLGKVIESGSGQPYSSYVRQRLFEPLGLSHSGFGVAGAEGMPSGTAFSAPHSLGYFEPGASSPYVLRGMPLRSGPHASFDLHTTVSEFSTLLACVLGRGEAQGVRVLACESIDRLLETRHPMTSTLSVGSGFNVFRSTLGDIFFENAEHFGHSAAMLWIPDVRVGLVAMTNRGSAGFDLSTVLNTVQRHLTRGEDLDHRHREPEALTGQFVASQGSQLKVVARGRDLEASIDDEAPAPLIYRGQGRFLKTGGRCARYLLAMDSPGGKVQGFAAGPFYFARREKETQPNSQEPKSLPLLGIYRNPKAGRVALFERKGRLIIAFSPEKEAVLEPSSPGCFVQKDGPFANEVVLVEEENQLMLGNLVFEKTCESY